MDTTRVVPAKLWDPTRVLPEKHLTRLNEGFADPTSKPLTAS